RMNPRSSEAQYLLGVALKRSGQAGAAQKAFTETRRAHQNNASTTAAITRMQQGAGKLQKNDLDGAIADFREALGLARDLPQAYLFLGAALISKGELDEAIATLQKALQLKPQYFEAYYNLGLARARQGDFDSAIREFRSALELNKTHVEC